MLGKGLESLIPPSKGGPQDGQGAPDPWAKPPVTPSDFQAPPMAQNDPISQAPEPKEPEPILPPIDPIPAISAPSEEPLLPPAEPEPILPAPQEEALLPEAPAKIDVMSHSPEAVAEKYAVKPAPRQKSEAVFYLETDKIHPNSHQPRRHFDDEALSDLAASIREFGIIQPLVVTKIEKEVPTGTEVEYELIAGERRLQAAKRAGLERVPAIIRTVDVLRERLELAIIENLQRENLSPIEMARAFAQLQEEFRMTQREIATRLGKSREVVANTMRLLDLPAYIQEAIGKGQVSESHGRLLLAIEDPVAQQALFNDLLNQHMTTRELRRRAAMVNRKEVAHEADSPELKHFEDTLKNELGAPVSIRSTGGAGKITIDFYSPEELAQIIQRFRVDEF